MKRPVISFVFAVLVSVINAQAPQKMSYQCIIRNSDGELMVNSETGIRISIVHGTSDGTIVFQEIYNPNPKTNENGLVSIEIGAGIATFGTFSSINWSNGPYFVKTETDPSGGTNYTIAGTSQLLSVPYAFLAGSSESADDAVKLSGDQSISGIKTFTGTIDADNNIIKNVAVPENPTDAANKEYVDQMRQQLLDLMSSFSSVPLQGLVAFYPFNGNANDASGNGNNGTMTGCTFVPGKVGSCIQLDWEDHIDVPDSPSLNPAKVTVSFWINFDTIVNVGNQFLVSKGNDGTKGSYYISQNEHQYFDFYLGANGIDQVYVSSQIVTFKKDVWYHVAGTYDGTLMKIYFNGILSGTTTAQRTLGNTQPLCIGYQNRPLWPYYTKGRIDQIRIYNRALSESEIIMLYNEPGK